jgi:hypothetical protein
MAAGGRSLGAIGAVHYNRKLGARPTASKVHGAQLRQRLQLLAEYPRLSLKKAMKRREFVTLLGSVEGQFAAAKKLNAVAAKYFEDVEKSLRRSTES